MTWSPRPRSPTRSRRHRIAASRGTFRGGSMESVASTIVGALKDGGVGAIFGVPGGQTLPLYAEAARMGLPHVLMRDERSAACAADAYARLSGRVGFCDATVGPGATNLVSGLA